MCLSDREWREVNRERFNQLLEDETETRISRAELVTRIDNQGRSFSDIERLAFERSEMEYVDFSCFERIITSKDAQASMFKRFLYFIADLVISRKQRPKVHSNIDRRLWQCPPIFMTMLTVFQISIFFYYYSTSEKGTLMGYCGGCTETKFMFHPHYSHQLWRFFTHSFVHAGLDHLLKNMSVQIFIGIPLEIAHRITKIGPVYILGVTCSAITAYARNPSLVFLGASGGDYAILFCHISNLILNWKDMPYRRSQASVLIAFVLSDFVEDIYSFYKDNIFRIAHGAHFNSAITGLIYGFFVLYYVKKNQCWEAARYISLTAYFFYIIIVISIAYSRAS